MSDWWLWLGSIPRQVAWKFCIKYCIPSHWSITTHFNFLSFPEWRIKLRDLKIIEARSSVCSDLWLFCQWSSKWKCELSKSTSSFWDHFLLKLSKFTGKTSLLSFPVLWLHFSLLFWLLCFSSPILHAFSSFSALHFLALQKLERVSSNVLACFSLKSHLCHRLRKSENNQNPS